MLSRLVNPVRNRTPMATASDEPRKYENYQRGEHRGTSNGVNSKEIGFRRVLGNRNFFFLWIGQAISLLGDKFNQMALIALVTLRAPGSLREMTRLILFLNLPILLVGPWAGVYVDRWNRKKTMIVSDVLRGLGDLAIPLVAFLFISLPPIYLIVLLVYTITSFFQPAQLALIPHLVEREGFLTANAVMRAAAMVAIVVGAKMGDWVVAQMGVNSGFYIDAGTYFFSALCISLIILPRLVRGREKPKKVRFYSPIKKVGQELIEGLKVIKNNRIVFYAVAALAILLAGGGASFGLIILFIKEHFEASLIGRFFSFLGQGALGTIYGLLGAGMVLGAILTGKFGQKIAKEKIIMGSLISAGIVLLLIVGILPFQESLSKEAFFSFFALISLFLGGTVVPVMIASDTLLHEVLPDEFRGRVFGARRTIYILTFLVCNYLVGRFAQTKDLGLVLGLTVVIGGALTFWNYRVFKRA